MLAKRILIIEDEVTISKALNSKLSNEGFETLQAKNGAEGLKIALIEKPDLILLDIIMPKMDGLTMLKKIRKNKWGQEVPIILLTNLNDSEKVKEGMDSGVYDYLVKSDWKLGDVVKKVKEKLKIS